MKAKRLGIARTILAREKYWQEMKENPAASHLDTLIDGGISSFKGSIFGDDAAKEFDWRMREAFDQGKAIGESMEMLTVTQAAALLNYSTATCRLAAVNGDVDWVRKFGRGWKAPRFAWRAWAEKKLNAHNEATAKAKEVLARARKLAPN